MENKTKHITVAAMFAAMICVITVFPKVPVVATNGYIHLGDGLCLVAAWLLGPVFGGLASGIGSALADAIGGYGIYIPATFVIKTVSYFAAGIIFKHLKMHRNPAYIISAFIAEFIMVCGYFIFEWLITGNKLTAALSAVPPNVIQGVAGIAIGIVITQLVINNKEIKKYFNIKRR